jgi:hypothetical protein
MKPVVQLVSVAHGSHLFGTSTPLSDQRFNPKALYDLAQQHNPAVRRQQPAIKSDVQTLTRHR